MGQMVTFQPSQVALIRRTVAKDTNETEFDLFLEMCKARGLNPLLRHVYAFVFHKDKKDKRQMTIVVSIDGQRHLAQKTGAYRPDSQAPRFEISEDARDPLTNPTGLISAEVSVYKHSHGEWFPVTETAYWDETAPLQEIWDNGVATGRYRLDPKKDGWRKMPRRMLAKCAEMAALRKAFPDDFAGLYGEEEMDRGVALDMTPSELADKAEQEDRLRLIGGNNTLIIDWMDGQGLCKVRDGDFFDRAAEFIRTCAGDPRKATSWREQNRHSLQEFWARHKGDALALKKIVETAENQPLPVDPQIDLEELLAKAAG